MDDTRPDFGGMHPPSCLVITDRFSLLIFSPNMMSDMMISLNIKSLTVVPRYYSTWQARVAEVAKWLSADITYSWCTNYKASKQPR